MEEPGRHCRRGTCPRNSVTAHQLQPGPRLARIAPKFGGLCAGAALPSSRSIAGRAAVAPGDAAVSVARGHRSSEGGRLGGGGGRGRKKISGFKSAVKRDRRLVGLGRACDSWGRRRRDWEGSERAETETSPFDAMAMCGACVAGDDGRAGEGWWLCVHDWWGWGSIERDRVVSGYILSRYVMVARDETKDHPRVREATPLQQLNQTHLSVNQNCLSPTSPP